MNRFIIADASKCIGCRTCEVACVVSHQENQDCASLTPETFLPRIHVIKGVNISLVAKPAWWLARMARWKWWYVR